MINQSASASRMLPALLGLCLYATACDVRDANIPEGTKAADPDARGAPALQLLDTIRLTESDTLYVGSPAWFLAAGDGTYLIADQVSASVHHYAADGRLLKRFGKRGQGPGELTSPERTALGGDSLLYVIDDLKMLKIFDYRTGGFVRQLRPGRTIHTLAVQGDRIFFNALDRDAHSTVASIGANGAIETGGPFPPPLGRSRVLDEFFGYMHIAAIGDDDTIAVAIMSNRNVFVGSFRGGTFKAYDVPIRRRQGSREDLMANVTDENLKAVQDAVDKLSVPMAIGRLSTGQLAYIAADDATVENRRTRRMYLSIIDRDARRSCVDALIRANADVQPFAALRGDTLFVLDREIRSATNAQLVIRKYAVDTHDCEWIAEAA